MPMSKLEIGVLVGLTGSPDEEIRKVADFDLRHCQVCTWKPELYTDAVGQALTAAAEQYGVTITTLWSGYPGPQVWNFIDGPKTIGLVPPEFRAMRVEALQKAARFAAKFGLPSITTHAGFLPENPNDPDFDGTVDALRQIVDVCSEVGIGFCFETGQETPVTLLRTIERLGSDNVGINLDTANLILYGKANPADALDVFGKYVRDVHAKDGLYPTGGDELGKETPLGRGKVDFPLVISKLKALGYEGTLTIERETSGPQQIADIKAAVEFLRPLC
ncbi:MAG: sugar phosphate isomerase/epimerase family protein [Planctomycetota bacterium]|nr:sugar phosphate isomerase/epimerase family protein [Planctomycetota bacterium]